MSSYLPSCCEAREGGRREREPVNSLAGHSCVELKGTNFNKSIAAYADASPGAALRLLEIPLVFLRRSALPPGRLGALADDLFLLEP